MRTDKLMINADSSTIAAYQRGRAFKAVIGLVVVASFGVLTMISPFTASSNAPVIAPAVESSRVDVGHGASIDDPLTRGVDMHG